MRTNLLKLVALFALVVATASAPVIARGAAPVAGPSFSSIGPLAFAPDGTTLFAADRQAATIFALDLSAVKAGTAGTMSVPGIDQKLAALLGTDAAQIQITDLAVEPKSRNSYLSVMRGAGAAAQPALVRVDGAGKLEVVAFDALKFTSIALPNPAAATTAARNPRMNSVTDMALVEGKLYVTGLSNEEFASKFWAVPYPFKASDNGTSVEIYHGNHGAFETRSPVTSFVPTKINNQTTMIAGYTCTPLVRFPVGDLKPGAKVVGTTIAELGNQNTPQDMVLYKKDGKEFLLIHNDRRGVMKLATDPFGAAAGITTRIGGTAGVAFEPVTSMTGVTQLDLLDATHSIVLQRAEAGLNLTAVILP